MFYEHEPWGYEVEERRHLQALATAVNCVPRARGKKPLDWREMVNDPWADEIQHGFTEEQWEFIQKRKAAKQKRKGRR